MEAARVRSASRRRRPRPGNFLRGSVFTGAMLGLMAGFLLAVVYALDEGRFDVHAAGVLGIMALLAGVYFRDFREELHRLRGPSRSRLG